MPFTTRSLADVEMLAVGHPENPSDIRLGRFVTESETGSRALLGGLLLDRGETTRFTIPSEPSATARGQAKQEIYYVVRGEVVVTSSTQETIASQDDAIYFPPGDSYAVTGRSDETSYVLYVVTPAPR